MNSVKRRFYYVLLFFISLSATAQQPHLYVVLDTSGSMKNNVDWILEELLQVQDLLYAQQQSAEDLSMSLIGFTHKTEMLEEGNALAVGSAIDKLKLVGGVEDGILSISHLLQEKSTDMNGSYIVLITDENRDQTQYIDIQELGEKLKRHDIAFHLIDPVDRQNACQGFYQQQQSAKYASAINSQQVPPCITPKQMRQRFVDDEYFELVQASNGKAWFIHDMLKPENEFAETVAHDIYTKYMKQMMVDVSVSDVFQGQPVYFDATRHAHKNIAHQVVQWEWDFNDDGVVDDFGPLSSYVFNQKGEHTIKLTIRDDQQQPVTETTLVKLTVQ